MTDQQKLDIISDFENAEALFNFCGLDDIFADFCFRSQTEDLSLALYVYRYKADEFINYLELRKGFLNDYKRTNTPQ